MEWLDVPLKYVEHGMTGVLALFAMLSFFLLRREQSREHPRDSMLRTIRYFATICMLAATVQAISGYVGGEPASSSVLSGEWTVTSRTITTSYLPFRDMELTYRVFVSQTGSRLSGKGEKLKENNEDVAPEFRSNIDLDGEVKGQKVFITIEESGVKRTSSAKMDLTIRSDQRILDGTFSSTVANSEGTVVWIRK